MRPLAALLFAAALAAPPAAAIDSATGRWEGKIVCDSTNAATTERLKVDGTFLVTDLGDGNAFAVLDSSPLVVRLAVLSGADQPDRGRLVGPSCGFAANAETGSLFEAAVRIKPASEKGTMTGQYVNFQVGAGSRFVQVCRFKMRRVAPTLAVPLESCP